MAAKIIFGIHCHQPVGNFDFVIKKAFSDAYKPFLERVSLCKDFKFSLHMSGILLEYMKEKENKLFDLIKQLVDDGRLEIIISGFYEPILSYIPEADRIDQILLAKEFVEKEFGYTPSGLWLTERIWEQSIVKDLSRCGIKYVLVDDYHFLCAGKSEEEVYNYYITEYEGKSMYVFPISERLRYLIPFKPVKELVDYLRGKEGFLTIYDDGEKFGIWPGTKKWVYSSGWLDDFLRAVSEGKIETISFAEAMSEYRPEGRVYLPSTSYFEMSEWTLPARLALKYKRIVEDLKKKGSFNECKPFIRGGIWPNFLVKYPESNRMHKRMIWVSERLRHLDRNSFKRKALFRSQCNDAYWHGIFGGLYLPHLRRAIYANLLEAEEAVKDYGFIVEDVDCDGYEEVLYRGGGLSVWVFPRYGGQILEFSVRSWRLNLTDVIKRRIEHYHLAKFSGGSGGNGIASIHDIVRSPVDVDYEEDFYERGAFVDRIFTDWGVIHLANEFYDFDINDGKVVMSYNGPDVTIRKSYDFDRSLIFVEYEIESSMDIQHEFEININPATPDALFCIGSKSESVSKKFLKTDVDEVTITSPFFDVPFRIKVHRDNDLFVFPIYTLSQSERGFDKIYQGTAFIFKARKKAKKERFLVELEVGYV